MSIRCAGHTDASTLFMPLLPCTSSASLAFGNFVEASIGLFPSPLFVLLLPDPPPTTLVLFVSAGGGAGVAALIPYTCTYPHRSLSRNWDSGTDANLLVSQRIYHHRIVYFYTYILANYLQFSRYFVLVMHFYFLWTLIKTFRFFRVNLSNLFYQETR